MTPTRWASLSRAKQWAMLPLLAAFLIPLAMFLFLVSLFVPEESDE